MTHPLTDDLILENFTPEYGSGCYLCGEVCLGFNNDGLRAAYDLAIEQVIIQWEEVNSLDRTDTQVVREFDKRLLAMSQQVVDLPQANSDVFGKEGMERALQRTFEENDELMRRLSDS